MREPFESYLMYFLIPLMALSVVAQLHWDEVLGLFGMGSASRDFSLRWKDLPLPWGYVATVLLVFLVLELLSYAEELVRFLRQRRA